MSCWAPLQFLSDARFGGGVWFLGNVGSLSSSTPRADHFDPRGFEIYDIGSAGVAALSDQPPPADTAAQGLSGESLLLLSDNKADCSTTAKGEYKVN